MIVYRCGFAVEKTKYLLTYDDLNNSTTVYSVHEDAKSANDTIKESDFPLTRWSRKELEPLENALHLVKGVLEGIKSRYAADCTIFLSGTRNFRDSIASTKRYKGNRDQQQKPTHFDGIREYLVSSAGAIVTEDQEADDAIGIAMQPERGDVCVSLDKDLDQLPGRHYNWVDQVEYEVGKREALLNFYAQVLSGDPTDNVPGLPGIGRVKARRMLEGASTPLEAWKIVKQAYHDLDMSPEYLLEQARLVYIRRRPNEMWEFPKEEVPRTSKDEVRE